MPTSANVALPLVPLRPRGIGPADEDADKKAWKDGSRKEQGKTSSSEWIDVDEDKPRRRRKVRRTPPINDVSKKQTKSQERRSVSNDIGRFFPKLSQIVETNEPKPQPRPRPSESRTYAQYEGSPLLRRPAGTRESGLQRQQESLLQLNASLLSVISGFTTSTDRSSGSNSTVTQRSYRRRHDHLSRRPHRSHRRGMSDVGSAMSSPTRSQISYEYPADQGDGESIVSSSASSHPSEVNSSDAPGTPSSRSTYSSPTFSHLNNSGERPQAKRQHAPSPSNESSIAYSTVTGSDVSDQSESTYGEPSLIDGHYFYREPDAPIVSQASPEHAGEPLLAPTPAHPSAFSAQYFEDMQRSRSHSSTRSNQPAQQALQHYYAQPLTPEAVNPLSLSQNTSEQDALDSKPPIAPEAPSLDQRTLAGYEKLAYELASSTSSVRPMYRKFEFLNHRLLLHLQDELAELEEQLRMADEIIAQMEPGDGKRLPASRRGEAYYGADIHHHRTALLGRIFVKTEQYNKAMSSYSNMVRDYMPVKAEDITSYRSWMAEETPVHEIEARFLVNTDDLVVPQGSKRDEPALTTAVTICCALVLMLPPALFAVVPTVLGRFTITIVIAMTTIIIRKTTSLLSMVPLWDMAACVTAFVLLMFTVALCVPYGVAI